MAGLKNMTARLAVPGALIFALVGLLALAGCGTTTAGGNSSTPPPPAPTATTAPAQPTATSAGSGNTVTVKIIGASGNYSFSPASVTVKVGDTVMWVNDTAVPHTSTSDSGAAMTWDSSSISNGGGTFSMAFTKAGTFAYHCAFHPFMHGKVIVTA
ncbi:MAG: cupredoxin domain-containing protein [Chloroflexota bacterium]|nr:cupredoxin domain-containing protein [Chloroflexota bacterium]